VPPKNKKLKKLKNKVFMSFVGQMRMKWDGVELFIGNIYDGQEEKNLI
jgi:hypothetical protein